MRNLISLVVYGTLTSFAGHIKNAFQIVSTEKHKLINAVCYRLGHIKNAFHIVSTEQHKLINAVCYGLENYTLWLQRKQRISGLPGHPKLGPRKIKPSTGQKL